MKSTHTIPRKRKSSLGPLIVVFFSLVVLTGFTGCIDVNFTKEAVEQMQEDEEIQRSDNIILTKENQVFGIEIEGSGTPSIDDFQRIGTKLFQNLSDPDASTIDDISLVLKEENITLKSKVFDFFIVPDTDRLYVSLDPVFSTVISPQVGGYFEITIKNSTGDVVVYERRVQTENKKATPYNFFPPKTTIYPGRWTVEIQGTGLQSPGNIFYSGNFDLEVHAHEPI